MGKDKENELYRDVYLPYTSTLDLRGKQSVRATFKLTEGCIDAISIVATHLGIKQKSLFDHLVEDARSLNSIAREIQNLKLRSHGRIQKTFVISRRSLTSLDSVSKHFNAPRDALVEYSVQRLLPIIAKEREKHEKRKEIFGELAKHFKKGEHLLKEAKDLLGVDDPIYYKIKTIMTGYENAVINIESFIEKGKIIESFHPDALKEILTRSGEREQNSE
ncbi:MAG: hypothetical protein JSW04_11855 [Desulfobacterales bacterium]|nr:MAG: hypothetical protein JSW04_11855 [Desulfobacterales bacterium]